MRVLSRCIAVMLMVTGILTALIAGVVPAGAQCAAMGGGGHDHAATRGHLTASPAGSEKKMRQSIERLLSDERGRVLLTDALLSDQAMREVFVQRLASNPKWRAMASQQLSAPAPARADGADSHGASGGTAVVYVCPMHADITSSGPGSCAKCGMALVRRESQRE